MSTALTNLQVAYETLNKDGGNTETNQKALIEAEKQLNTEIKTVTSSITSMNASLAKTSQVDSLKQTIQKFYDINTATHNGWGGQIKKILAELNSEAGVTPARLEQIKQEFYGIENAARRAGKLGLSFFDTIKQGMKSFSYWTSATAIVMQGITAVRQGVSTVISLDTALVDLKKTTSMTSDELKQFYYDANDVAKQMGVTTEEIINQASAWSRLGYSTAEASTQMAKLSSQFKLISPGMTSDEATNGLVSVMKAYKMGVDEVKDGIMSPINIVGNNFALDNTNIVNMLQDSVSAMAEANNTLEETIALETAAFEITQDENVGNGFKTVALRLRGISEEGEEVDGTLQNIKSDLYDLTGVSIMQDANTYKSTYQILKEISDVWDNLSDKKRAEALELMFGKHRANIGAAVLSNFSAAEKAMDDMANSAGSADAELSVAMDSIEYKLNHLSETGTGIAQSLFNTEDMKRVLDFVNLLADGLDKITGFLGLFPTAGAGLGAFLGIKDVGISVLVAY